MFRSLAQAFAIWLIMNTVSECAPRSLVDARLQQADCSSLIALDSELHEGQDCTASGDSSRKCCGLCGRQHNGSGSYGGQAAPVGFRLASGRFAGEYTCTSDLNTSSDSENCRT